LVDWLDRYRQGAKRRADYLIWRQGVRIWTTKRFKRAYKHEIIDALSTQIRAARLYVEPAPALSQG
jgi:hypothetical protein